MQLALDEARRGQFRVEPNPMVGAAVLDRDGAILWAQAHERFGGMHAEAATVDTRPMIGDHGGGTLVVTLEPCAHTSKKTPPCVPRIIDAGIVRVVAGAPDPNPATAGLAAKAFAQAGIAYEVLSATSPLGAACRALIERYVRHLGAERPWMIAKWATSLDGRTADASGASRWISGEESRDVVWELRETVDAVIVGRGTVLADDPQLISRRESARRALRVVFDSTLRTSPTAKLVATAREVPTLLVAAPGADASRRAALEAAGAQVVEVASGPDGRVDVGSAFRELHRRGVRRALLESGGTLTAACVRAGVVDQVATFVAPVVIGGAGPSPFAGQGWPIADAPRLEEVRVTPVGEDALIEGYFPPRC
jgi:diaminohydroxyphosphoribosylaminopyrimidine deaminase/5-amino-6-(5-phosphoribosylamino)uracil reductase